MFFFLSKTLDVLLAPLTWAMLIALVGLSAKRPWMRSAPGVAVAVLYVFSIEPVSNGLWRYVEGRAPRSMRQDVTYEKAPRAGRSTTFLDQEIIQEQTAQLQEVLGRRSRDEHAKAGRSRR